MLVGESGSGKSVSSLAVMGLSRPAPAGSTPTSLRFDGPRAHRVSAREEMRRMRGGDMAMIFQEPMTSLNPAFTVGNQIAEAVRAHRKVLAQAGLGARGRDARPRRHPRPAPAREGLPARVLGRHAAAGDDRDGALVRPEAADRRRADDRARRHDPGADPRTARSSCSASSGWRCCSSPTTSVSSPTSATASS